MQAIVLAGGEGTRLRPLTLTRPKPALTLVDRPFVTYIVDWLDRHGIDEIVMACGFGAAALREALEGRGDREPRIRYVEEPGPLGTGGPVRLAAEAGILEDRFLVLNGDLLADLDLGVLIEAHVERGAVATLALHPVEDPSSYGLVRREGGPEAPGDAPTSPGGEVSSFVEKPGADEIDTDEISAGVYVVERSILDLVPPGRAVSIEWEVFPRLVGDGLYGQRLEGYWMDVGTPERYLQASWDILEGRVRTDAASRVDRAGLLVSEGARVHAEARVNPPAMLHAGVVVGPRAAIGGRAVIGQGTEVAEEATVASSVVFGGGRIGSGAEVHGAILDSGVVVGDRARIEPGAVIGEEARIGAGVALPPEARLNPGEEVS